MSVRVHFTDGTTRTFKMGFGEFAAATRNLRPGGRFVRVPGLILNWDNITHAEEAL